MPSEEISRRMQLYWGVVPFVIKQQLKTEDCLVRAEQIIKDLKLAESGHHILLISGVGKSGIAANSIVVHQIS
jgi:pyruvate kinase